MSKVWIGALVALAVGAGGGAWWYMNREAGQETVAPDVSPVAPPVTDQGQAQVDTPPATGADSEPQVTPASAPPGTVSAEERVNAVVPGAIDWDAALADIAKSREAAGQSGLAAIASAGEPAPVPVLLPSGIATPANARAPRYKALEDGYFASFPGVRYDIVMNGSVARYETGATLPATREGYVFTPTDSGAQLSFSRYGAEYLIEFECKVLEDGLTCLDEAEAIEVANSLVPTGGR
jgi:hypothetical protein